MCNINISCFFVFSSIFLIGEIQILHIRRVWNRYPSRKISWYVGSALCREGTGFIHESSSDRRLYRRAFRFSGLSNRFRLSKLHRNRCRCPRLYRGVINQHLLIPTRARGGPARCRWTTCKKHGDRKYFHLKYNRWKTSFLFIIYKCAKLSRINTLYI